MRVRSRYLESMSDVVPDDWIRIEFLSCVQSNMYFFCESSGIRFAYTQKRKTPKPCLSLLVLFISGFPIQKLQNRILHLHVFDYDRFSRDDSIGEVFLPLCQVRTFTPSRFLLESLQPRNRDRKWAQLRISLYSVSFLQIHLAWSIFFAIQYRVMDSV